MTAQELRNKQLNDVAKTGGYWLPQNAIDGIDNDLNRDIIKAFKQEHGKAFLGFVNLPKEQLQDLQEGNAISIYEEYKGQRVYNFGCDFIVPEADTQLESLIRQWNKIDSTIRDSKLMNSIFSRIRQLKGFNLIWS